MVGGYEILYKTGDSWARTIIGIGQGVGSSVAVTVIVFANVEVVVLLAQMFRKKRFNEGRELGHREGRELGQEEKLQRVKEAFERFGIEVDGVQVLPRTPEVEEFLNRTGDQA